MFSISLVFSIFVLVPGQPAAVLAGELIGTGILVGAGLLVIDARAGRSVHETRYSWLLSRIFPATGRQHVDVELVAIGVGHQAPLEAFQLAGLARLQPAAAESFNLGRRAVQIVHDQVQVQPVLARLDVRHLLKPDDEAVLGCGQHTELAVADVL